MGFLEETLLEFVLVWPISALNICRVQTAVPSFYIETLMTLLNWINWIRNMGSGNEIISG